MKIKFALCGLVILLFAVVTLSYYINKEGFETQTKADLVLAAVNDALTAVVAAKDAVFHGETGARTAIYKVTGIPALSTAQSGPIQVAIQIVGATPDIPATTTEPIKTGTDTIPVITATTGSSTPASITTAYTAVDKAKTAVETAKTKILLVAAAVENAKADAISAVSTAAALLTAASAQNTATTSPKTVAAVEVKRLADLYLKSINAITVDNINNKLTELSAKLDPLYTTIKGVNDGITYTPTIGDNLKTQIAEVTTKTAYIVPAVNALKVAATAAVSNKNAANSVFTAVNTQNSTVRVEVQTDHDNNKFRIKAKAINATGSMNVRIFDESGKSITPMQLMVQPNVFTELYSGPESNFNDGDTYNIVEGPRTLTRMPPNAIILGSFTYSKPTGSSAYPSWFQHSPQGSWSDGTWGIDGSYNPPGTGTGANTAPGATATGAAGLGATATGATGLGATPQRNDVVSQVGLTDTGYNAMELQQRAELLQDIQKTVRNELLASRSLTPTTFNPDNLTTTSLIQGEEYGNNCHKENEYRCPKNPDGTCPPIPDMTDYIKKDSIPCWGCNIDY